MGGCNTFLCLTKTKCVAYYETRRHNFFHEKVGYNVKLHYETHEKHKHFQLEEERKVAFERLKNQKERQQQMFKKISCQKNDAFEATYRVALLLGKRGKPFSDLDQCSATGVPRHPSVPRSCARGAAVFLETFLSCLCVCLGFLSCL